MLRVPAPDLRAVAQALLRASGVDGGEVEAIADNLLWNDLAGRTNHGVERLPILLRRVQAGLIRTPARMTFRSLSEAAALLDADDGFGQVAGALATDRAVDLARATGLGVVGVQRSNFYGTGAYYINRAAGAGMISIALSNSFPKVAAEGGYRPVLGTNPFAFGAPRRDGRALIVDMSTAGLAGSTVRAHQQDGRDLPEGLVVDEDGRPVTDPDAAMRGTLLPASGPKGFGLALMVEILSGVLTGAGVSSQVASMYKDFERHGNSGHFILALDIARWMPIETFYDRLELLAGMVASSGGEGCVRLPGDARWDAMAENREQGIALEDKTATALRELAGALGTAVPW
ncbi:Ldh family oxidoreductase [Actibacterium sp. MT2.3-13A]|uniref:Ldh family oxidoreductase n=1 Tax=Actibacterium sp. MT2.3-13A TaxID=2828332 RepID=UPI001BA5940A|nr:Ldh family oxidoreductase [Actibacterium sp. MT2.3-13A]